MGSVTTSHAYVHVQQSPGAALAFQLQCLLVKQLQLTCGVAAEVAALVAVGDQGGVDLGPADATVCSAIRRFMAALARSTI